MARYGAVPNVQHTTQYSLFTDEINQENQNMKTTRGWEVINDL